MDNPNMMRWPCFPKLIFNGFRLLASYYQLSAILVPITIGRSEAMKKEKAAQDRLDELQNNLTSVIEQNRQLTAEVTKTIIQEESKKQRIDNITRVARKMLTEQRRKSTAQYSAVRRR